MVAGAASLRRGPISGMCGNWRTWGEEAVDQLLPILFVGGFAKPVSNQSIVVDDYFRYLFKEEAEVPYDDVLVVKTRTSDFPFVLATCS